MFAELSKAQPGDENNSAGGGNRDKDDDEVQAVNQVSISSSSKAETPMDVMRSAMINLSTRVQEIEKKVTKVEKLI